MPDNIRKPASPAGRYLLYAVGEILLVVIGILLALQVNNWNENRLLEAERNQLIRSLTNEMTTTIERMERAIEYTDRYLSSGITLMKVVPEGGAEITVDSIRTLFDEAFGLVTIQPQLTNYNEAVSSGRIALIDNEKVLQQYTELLDQKNRYERHITIGSNHFYMGPIWDLKKELGDIRVLLPIGSTNTLPEISEKYMMDESSFRAYIAKPRVFAVIQNNWIIMRGLMEAFVGMRDDAIIIKEELLNMQS